MFNLFKPKSQPTGKVVTLKISGMHCSSCSLNIEGELEDTPGVFEATANYAKGQAVVRFDPVKVSQAKLSQVIAKLGYQVV